MTAWVVAAAIGLAVGLLGYAPALRGRPALGWLAAAVLLAGAGLAVARVVPLHFAPATVPVTL